MAKKNAGAQKLGSDLLDSVKKNVIVLVSMIGLIVSLQSFTSSFASASDLDKIRILHNTDIKDLRTLIVSNENARKKDSLLVSINQYTDRITVIENKPALNMYDQKTVRYYIRKREDLKTQLTQLN